MDLQRRQQRRPGYGRRAQCYRHHHRHHHARRRQPSPDHWRPVRHRAGREGRYPGRAGRLHRRRCRWRSAHRHPHAHQRHAGQPERCQPRSRRRPARRFRRGHQRCDLGCDVHCGCSRRCSHRYPGQRWHRRRPHPGRLHPDRRGGQCRTDACRRSRYCAACDRRHACRAGRLHGCRRGRRSALPLPRAGKRHARQPHRCRSWCRRCPARRLRRQHQRRDRRRHLHRGRRGRRSHLHHRRRRKFRHPTLQLRLHGRGGQRSADHHGHSRYPATRDRRHACGAGRLHGCRPGQRQPHRLSHTHQRYARQHRRYRSWCRRYPARRLRREHQRCDRRCDLHRERRGRRPHRSRRRRLRHRHHLRQQLHLHGRSGQRSADRHGHSRYPATRDRRHACGAGRLHGCRPGQRQPHRLSHTHQRYARQHRRYRSWCRRYPARRLRREHQRCDRRCDLHRERRGRRPHRSRRRRLRHRHHLRQQLHLHGCRDECIADRYRHSRYRAERDRWHACGAGRLHCRRCERRSAHGHPCPHQRHARQPRRCRSWCLGCPARRLRRQHQRCDRGRHLHRGRRGRRAHRHRRQRRKLRHRCRQLRLHGCSGQCAAEHCGHTRYPAERHRRHSCGAGQLHRRRYERQSLHRHPHPHQRRVGAHARDTGRSGRYGSHSAWHPTHGHRSQHQFCACRCNVHGPPRRTGAHRHPCQQRRLLRHPGNRHLLPAGQPPLLESQHCATVRYKHGVGEGDPGHGIVIHRQRSDPAIRWHAGTRRLRVQRPRQRLQCGSAECRWLVRHPVPRGLQPRPGGDFLSQRTVPRRHPADRHPADRWKAGDRRRSREHGR